IFSRDWSSDVCSSDLSKVLKMFEYHGNTLCVQANWLDEIGIASISNLKFLTHKGKIKKARSGRGLGNYALYVYESLPQRFRTTIEHDLGIDPYEESKTI